MSRKTEEMRAHCINLEGATQEELNALTTLFKRLGEEIWENNTITLDSSYPGYQYFHGSWNATEVTTTITLQHFLQEFDETYKTLRSCRIGLKNATQQQLDAFRQILKDRDEPIWDDTEIFNVGGTENVAVFSGGNFWCGGGGDKNISMEEFLEKFGGQTSMKMRTHKIDLRSATMTELQDLQHLFAELDEPVYEFTNMFNEDREPGAHFLDGSWCGYTNGAYTITITDFLKKFDTQKPVDIRDHMIQISEASVTQLSELKRLLPLLGGVHNDSTLSNEYTHISFEEDHWYGTTNYCGAKSMTIELALELLHTLNKDVAKLRKEPQRGYRYSYDYKKPIYYSDLTQQQEAIDMDIKEVLYVGSSGAYVGLANNNTQDVSPSSTPPSDCIKWSQLKSELLIKVNAMYSYEKVVVLTEEGQESWIHGVSAKDVDTCFTKFPVVVVHRSETRSGKTAEEIMAKSMTQTFEEFKGDVLANINEMYTSGITTTIPEPPVFYDIYKTVVRITCKEENDHVKEILGWNDSGSYKYMGRYDTYLMGYLTETQSVFTNEITGAWHGAEEVSYKEYCRRFVVKTYDKDKLLVKVFNEDQLKDAAEFFDRGIEEYHGGSSGSIIGRNGAKGSVNTVSMTNDLEPGVELISYEEFLTSFRPSIGHKIPKIQKPKEPEVTYWKNPKPNNKNQREHVLGGFVLVDGLDPMQIVEKITAKMVYLKDIKKRYKKEDVYPVFKLEKAPIEVGNIYQVSGIYKVYKSGLGLSIGNDRWAMKPEEIRYNKYLDGAITYGGEEYTTPEKIQERFPEAKLKAMNIDVSHSHSQIAKHYDIPDKDIIAKDVHIRKAIVTALDHPLNVAAKEWALVYGPSGTGKTEISIDYAKNKGRSYVKLQGTAQLTVDDFIGYKSITTGDYFRSLLREAVEYGHVFILDEMDACNPNTLLVLNGLKQEMFQFPDKLVKVHKDFRMIATANTLTYDETYNARSPLDKATRARFKEIEYSLEEHELAIRYGLKYIKKINNIDRLTARDVARQVIDLKIKEEN